MTPGRAAAGIAVLGVMGAVAGIVMELSSGRDLLFLSFFVAMAGFAVAGSVVVAKRPTNPVGWLLAGYGISALTAQATAQYAAIAADRGWIAAGVAGWAGAWTWALGLPLLGIALLRFPDGAPLSRNWRYPEHAGAAGLALLGLVAALLWPHRATLVNVTDPSAFPGAAAGVWTLAYPLVFLPVLAGAAALVVRYRRSDSRVRAQIRWVVYPVSVTAIGVLGFVLTGAPGAGAHPAAEVLALSGMLGTPVAIAVAVLRYRLYEIDQLISRTLSYALVIALLATVYVTGVVLIGRVVSPTGQSDLAVAASTLLVAALFSPLRRRMKSVVDRRFDRARYDARLTVEQFAGSLRTSVAEGDLLGELTSVVARTVHPASVSVWLRRADA